MNIYQASDGRWLIYNNGIKSDYFNTQSEAENMATKLKFATQSQAAATALAQVGDDFSSLVDIYFDRGYDSSGSNPIIDDDLASLGITAAQMASLITAAQQLANYLNNNSVTTGDYGATLNSVRTDK